MSGPRFFVKKSTKWPNERTKELLAEAKARESLKRLELYCKKPWEVDSYYHNFIENNWVAIGKNVEAENRPNDSASPKGAKL